MWSIISWEKEGSDVTKAFAWRRQKRQTDLKSDSFVSIFVQFFNVHVVLFLSASNAALARLIIIKSYGGGSSGDSLSECFPRKAEKRHRPTSRGECFLPGKTSQMLSLHLKCWGFSEWVMAETDAVSSAETFLHDWLPGTEKFAAAVGVALRRLMKFCGLSSSFALCRSY